MDRNNAIKREPDPRLKANFFSIVTFFYTIKLFIKAYTGGFEIENIYETPPKSRSKHIVDNLETQWKKEETKECPSIIRTLWFSYGQYVLFIGVILFINSTVLTIWLPKAESKVISYFDPNQSSTTYQNAILYLCLFIVLKLLGMMVTINLGLILTKLGIEAKIAISSLLYRKVLKVNSLFLSEATIGKVVTIITKDVEMIEPFFNSANDIWIGFIQTLVVCYLIYARIGIFSLLGISVFLIILPLQILIAKCTYNYRLKCSKKSDERLDLIREVLATSKIIKMYTWEKFFGQKIEKARKEEIRMLHRIFFTQIWIGILAQLSSKSAFIIFLLIYMWTSSEISVETIYYILSCLNRLQETLNGNVPVGLKNFIQLYAVTQRIQSVLNLKELPPTVRPQLKKASTPVIKLTNVHILHDKTVILKDISLEINEGLHILTGHMGSGKSMFLKSLLGECQTSGKLDIKGTISFASQDPWLFPSTIKNNILFCEKFNPNRYHEVLKVCELEFDLHKLPNGEDTVVGEGGTNLSKGQQARITLARAIYRISDIYFLDDCLASLDANVSDNIFKNCICQFLKDKITIFVTNNSSYLKYSERVLEIQSKTVTMKSYVHQNLVIPFENQENLKFEEKKPKTDLQKSVYYETKRSGRVPLKIYLKYIRFGGGILALSFIAILFVITQFTSSYSEKAFSRWVNLEQNISSFDNISEKNKLHVEVSYQWSLYISMVATSIVLSVVKSFSYFYFARTASNNIHKAMVTSIINSAIEFFDCHFIGNVINRFTKDFLTQDDTLPAVAIYIFEMVFTVFGGVVLLTTVNQIFLLECIIFLLIACCIKQFCQPAGRNTERVHVIARNPINGHLHSTLEGLVTIRANKAEETVTEEFDKHQDLFTSAYFMVVTVYTALKFFLFTLNILFNGFIITQFFIIDLEKSVGDLALVISQSSVITGIVVSGIMSIADCENLMISVERIMEFTRLKQEPTTGKIFDDWPKFGSLKFDRVSLHYKENKILEGVEFALRPGEKLGIVGRTGAGKSSIISTLLRLYESQGNITIDEIDIKTVALHCLRSNISVIPQQPYLFNGTIRENIDPLKKFTDYEIWQKIKELNLNDLIKDLNKCIDKASFSDGQKQLLCLTRAILPKNKIVILDEATAHVDKETEILMQKTIEEHFKDATMLVVAHKASAVRKCDKIIVLESGKVQEMGSPKELMQNKKSLFCYVMGQND